MIGFLRTRVRKQPIIALYFESENELKFYNLQAWFTVKHLYLADIFNWCFIGGKNKNHQNMRPQKALLNSVTQLVIAGRMPLLCRYPYPTKTIFKW